MSPVENVRTSNARASGWRMLRPASAGTGARSGPAGAGIALMTIAGSVASLLGDQAVAVRLGELQRGSSQT